MKFYFWYLFFLVLQFEPQILQFNPQTMVLFGAICMFIIGIKNPIYRFLPNNFEQMMQFLVHFNHLYTKLMSISG